MDDRVINSRTSADGKTVKRRRQCLTCEHRFTTYERVEDTILRVVKKDGSRDDYARAKILAGLMKACYKRPISVEQLENLVDEVEMELYKKYEREVPSDAIGELVMEKLRALDHVAYIRFASVYREFQDVTDFVHEADTVLRKGGAQAGGPRQSGDAKP